jgi:ABC-type phosphate/phosphonate transport system permease subunit
MLKAFCEIHILVAAMQAEFIETVTDDTSRQIWSHGTDHYQACQHNYVPEKSRSFLD